MRPRSVVQREREREKACTREREREREREGVRARGSETVNERERQQTKEGEQERGKQHNRESERESVCVREIKQETCRSNTEQRANRPYRPIHSCVPPRHEPAREIISNHEPHGIYAHRHADETFEQRKIPSPKGCAT